MAPRTMVFRDGRHFGSAGGTQIKWDSDLRRAQRSSRIGAHSLVPRGATQASVKALFKQWRLPRFGGELTKRASTVAWTYSGSVGPN